MEFLVEGAPRRIEITTLVIAGWTGRDKAAVEHHIAELAAIGVKRPRSTPCFYRLGANLLTAAPEVEVVGEDSSGEGSSCLLRNPVRCTWASALIIPTGKSRPTASPFPSRCAPSRSAGSFGDSRRSRSIGTASCCART